MSGMTIFDSLSERLDRLTAPFDKDKHYYRSQAGQDRFVLNKLFKKSKRNGFFLEMGAADGLLLSNTYVFEKVYNWNGILVEPTHKYDQLIKNRSAHCLQACVSSNSGYTFIVEVVGKGYASVDSENTLRSVTLAADSSAEATEKAKALFQGYLEENEESSLKCRKVEMITLDELLNRFGAPKVIDYFSLDVEGHEEEVFRSFSFKDYIFNVMNIEKPSKQLHNLILDNDYEYLVANKVGDFFYRHSTFKI